MKNYENDPQFKQVTKIFPLVKSALDLTDDPVVFGTIISSVVQIWAQERGYDQMDFIKDMQEIAERIENQEDEE